MKLHYSPPEESTAIKKFLGMSLAGGGKSLLIVTTVTVAPPGGFRIEAGLAGKDVLA
jgi:hypothetical protein